MSNRAIVYLILRAVVMNTVAVELNPIEGVTCSATIRFPSGSGEGSCSVEFDKLTLESSVHCTPFTVQVHWYWIVAVGCTLETAEISEIDWLVSIVDTGAPVIDTRHGEGSTWRGKLSEDTGMTMPSILGRYEYRTRSVQFPRGNVNGGIIKVGVDCDTLYPMLMLSRKY